MGTLSGNTQLTLDTFDTDDIQIGQPESTVEQKEIEHQWETRSQLSDFKE